MERMGDRSCNNTVKPALSLSHDVLARRNKAYYRDQQRSPIKTPTHTDCSSLYGNGLNTWELVYMERNARKDKLIKMFGVEFLLAA
jgi:hypothetical protein